MNLNWQTGLELNQGKESNISAKKYLNNIVIIKILWWNLKKKKESKCLDYEWNSYWISTVCTINLSASIEESKGKKQKPTLSLKNEALTFYFITPNILSMHMLYYLHNFRHLPNIIF